MRSLVSSRALRMMIPRERSPERARQSCQPSTRGIIRSSTTRCGLYSSTTRSATCPSGAVRTSISLMAQSERDEVGDALFVVHDEDAGRPTHCFEYMSRSATTLPRDDLETGVLSALSAARTLDRMTQKAGARVRAADGLGVAEIHAHTLASDGMVSATDLVRAAAAIGLNVLCITDHDTISDLEPAIEAGAALGVDVVRGEEVTASFPPGIHILGLFLDRQIRMHMSVEDTIDAIHDAGGLAIIAHPFMPTWFASMTPGKARHLLESRRVDGIELRHTAPVLPQDVGAARRLLRRAPRAARRRARRRRQPLRRARPRTGPDRVPREECRRPAQRDRGQARHRRSRVPSPRRHRPSACGWPSSTDR